MASRRRPDGSPRLLRREGALLDALLSIDAARRACSRLSALPARTLPQEALADRDAWLDARDDADAFATLLARLQGELATLATEPVERLFRAATGEGL